MKVSLIYLKVSGLGMVVVAFGRVKREHQSCKCTTISPQV